MIEKLKVLANLELLRDAREKFNKLYPLSPKLWLDWINDETTVASTADEKKAIKALYERAVLEYLDHTIWLNYLQFTVELNEESIITQEEVKVIFDRALNQNGCNVAVGSTFWRYYRLLVSHNLTENATEEQVKEHVKTTLDLFHRQFSNPLLNMEEDLKQFEEWLTQTTANHNVNFEDQQYSREIATIKADYEKSLKTLLPLVDFEMALKRSSKPELAEYVKYLDVEIKNGHLARTQCLFERAITDHCLEGDLWLKYLKFADWKLVVDKLLLPLYERAIRNCSWVGDIWVQYLLAVEALYSGNESVNIDDKMVSIRDQALLSTSSSVEDYKKIWFTYINFLRRQTCRLNAWADSEAMEKIRETLAKVIENLEATPNGVYFCYDLHRFAANMEAKFCKNIGKAREIYNALVSKSADFKKTVRNLYVSAIFSLFTFFIFQATFWLDYANLELLYGDEDHYRKTLYKGLNMCTDYPESIGTVLLRFESEDGNSVEQYRTSAAKYDFALKRANERRAKEAKNAVDVVTPAAATAEVPNKGGAQKRKATENGGRKDVRNDLKKPKMAKPEKSAVHGTLVQTDESKREQTAFISNLAFDLEEEEIRTAFTQFGPINEVRLVRDFKGRPKGFAYVEFENFLSVRKALKHDRMMLKGRPVFINEMDKRTKFSYSTDKEQNKIFVKNIPFEFSKEDLLAKVFADVAEDVVDIRLVTFRNGHSKGIAYVEMKSAEIAAKVAKEKNDMEIADRKLFVAISNPSAAKDNPKPPQSFNNRQGGDNRLPGSSSSSIMIPHSLMVRQSKVKIHLDGSNAISK